MCTIDNEVTKMANILEIIIYIVVIKICVKYLFTSQKNTINKIQKKDIPKKIYYINKDFVSIQSDNHSNNHFDKIDNLYLEPILLNERDINLTESNRIII
jgi:hypothetical protein